MTSVSVLSPFVNDDPADFWDLVASCCKFIDAWLDAGGEPTDKAVLGFYGLWAQSNGIRRGSEKAATRADYFVWAYPQFIEHRNDVRRLVESNLENSHPVAMPSMDRNSVDDRAAP